MSKGWWHISVLTKIVFSESSLYSIKDKAYTVARGKDKELYRKKVQNYVRNMQKDEGGRVMIISDCIGSLFIGLREISDASCLKKNF